MADFLPTFILTCILMTLALLAMSAGYLITKKKCLKKQCGTNPLEKDQSKCFFCSCGRKKNETCE